jgi:hypothetical protein
MKRTDLHTLTDINDAPDLQQLIHDKRSSKRATTTKGTRRNRRYENRLLNAHRQEEFDSENVEIDTEVLSDSDSFEETDLLL